MFRRSVILLFALALLQACGSSKVPAGSIGASCVEDDECDPGLGCRYAICVNPQVGTSGSKDVVDSNQPETSVDSADAADLLSTEDSKGVDKTTGGEGECLVPGKVECLSGVSAYRICKDGQWSDANFCNQVPCEATPGVPNSGVIGTCVADQGCSTTCTACPEMYTFDIKTVACRTSCKDAEGNDDDSLCWGHVAECKDGKCVAKTKLADGEICDIGDECTSGNCVAATKNGQLVPGLRVCCKEACTDDPTGKCQGCRVGDGICVQLVPRSRMGLSSQCEKICEGEEPDAGCLSGWDAFNSSDLKTAHIKFTDRLKLDPNDSRCAFGAALTTLFLSFEDTRASLGTCNHPELKSGLAALVYELGGSYGINVSTKIFGENGLFKALADARDLNQTANKPPTSLTVTRHYLDDQQAPKIEILNFKPDYMVTTPRGFTIVDRDSRRRLTVDCPDEKRVILGPNEIGDKHDVEQKNGTSVCSAVFVYTPDYDDNNEEERRLARYNSKTTDGLDDIITWEKYSIITNAVNIGALKLKVYLRDNQGTWLDSEYIEITGTVNDRTSNMDSILLAAIGDLAGFINGNPPLIGRTPDSSFQKLADMAKNFSDENLTAIIGFLKVATADAGLSIPLKPTAFHLPNHVDLTMDRADAYLLLGALTAAKAAITYMSAYRFDFDFGSQLDVNGLECQGTIDSLNPVWMTTKLDGAGLLAVHNSVKSLVGDAMKAIEQALVVGQTLTADSGITHWQKILPEAAALTTLAGALGALAKAVDGGAFFIAGMVDDKDALIKADFSTFFNNPFVHDPKGQLIPWECVKKENEEGLDTQMTDPFYTAWLGSILVPDVLTDSTRKWHFVHKKDNVDEEIEPQEVIRTFLNSIEPLFTVFSDN